MFGRPHCSHVAAVVLAPSLVSPVVQCFFNYLSFLPVLNDDMDSWSSRRRVTCVAALFWLRSISINIIWPLYDECDVNSKKSVSKKSLPFCRAMSVHSCWRVESCRHLVAMGHIFDVLQRAVDDSGSKKRFDNNF